MTTFPDPIGAQYLLAALERAVHQARMEMAMAYNERLLGVPYGPALCEVYPPLVRGLVPEVLRLMAAGDDLDPPLPERTTVRLGPAFYRPRPGSVLPIIRDGDDPRFPEGAQ